MRSALKIALLLSLSGLATGQTLLASSAFIPPDPEIAAVLASSKWGRPIPLAPPAEPRISPELALNIFEQGTAAESHKSISYYRAVTIVVAELPDTNQRGEFELEREFSAPGELRFKGLHFSGDGFVKTNVINRWLTSEVQRAQAGPDTNAALSGENYKLTYKGATSVSGVPAYIFQLKPLRKAAGLFKGNIYLDSSSGALLRAEGEFVRSPSFFIKKLEFSSDFAQFAGERLPVHIHSQAQARFLGRVILDVSTPTYDFTPAEQLAAAR